MFLKSDLLSTLSGENNAVIQECAFFKFNGEMVEEMKKCVVAWMLNIVSSARISPQFHSTFPLKTSLLVLWQSRNLINFVFGVGVGFCCKIVGTFVLLSNWTCRNLWWVIWSQFGVRRLFGSTVWVNLTDTLGQEDVKDEWCARMIKSFLNEVVD